MKKRKHEKNHIRNRSGGMKRKLPGRLLSLMCALILVLSTVFLDLGHISRAYAFGDELYLETEAEETAEAGIETQAADPGDDESQISTELSEDTSEDPDEVFTEEAADAGEADFSSGDNLDEQELITEDESENADDSTAETIAYTQLIEDDTVEVRAEAPAGALPEGAQLVVKPIRSNTEDAKETEKYNTLHTKLTELAQAKAQNLEGFLSYDISFTDSEGNPVEPSEKVSYSFQYKEAAAPELTDPTKVTVSAAELKKNKETSEYELTELKPEEDKATLETNENKQLQKAGFQSADTAVFAFVWNSTAETADNINNEETQEATPIGIVEITADEVNLREAPSTEAEILATATAGTQFPLLETVAAEDESTWYKVSYTADTAAYIRSDMAVVLDENQEEEVPAEEVEILDNTGTLTFTKKVNDQVQVTATTEAGVIPEDAELIVNSVEEGTDQYSDTESRLNDKAESDGYKVAGFLAYDIYFQDSEGNKIHPEDGKVKVSIDYQEPSVPEEVKESTAEITADNEEAIAEDEADLSAGTEEMFQSDETSAQQKFSIAVMHLVEDKDGNVQSVVNMTQDGTANVEADEAGAVQKAEFETDSFSVFTIAWQDAEGRASSNDKLTTVPTVDHTSDGITMTMKDLVGDSKKIGPTSGSLIDIQGYYGNGNIKQGLLKNVLGADGYPIALKGDKSSLSTLFSGGTEVNHLFLQSVYNSTGYYEYSSFNNYAYLGDSTKLGEKADFTVYDAIGTPVSGESYFYRRGNFMPYNSISANNKSKYSNMYDEDGNMLKEGDSGYNRTLYKTNGSNNYYFSMEMKGNFLQPKGGLAVHNGTSSPMIYEFNGDDDMWIYIDNVLVLDIGGVHDAHSGKINFQTGVVSWKDCKKGGTPKEYKTTIKEMFHSARKFPDGSTWDDSKVSDYFTGDTFKDYSTHSFKMFYMERGAGASNLHMKFNIQVIPEGQVAVKKELDNTDKEKYSDAKFAFQLLGQKKTGTDAQGNDIYSETEYVPLAAGETVYGVKTVEKGVNEKATGETVELQNVDINGKSYKNVFYLKADEEAIFTGLQANRKYYVKEIGVESEKYDKITINGTSYKEFDENQQQSNEIADIETDKKAVSERPLVVYTNNCSAANSRELRITKKMNPDQETNDTFTFKVEFASETGDWQPYSGAYYLRDKAGNYWHYVNNELVMYEDNSDDPEETRICGTTTNGYISGIRKDDTVSITAIMSGTRFRVTEEKLDTETKYENPVYKVTNNAGQVTFAEGNEGVIELYHDAAVEVTNTPYSRIKVNKVWTDTADGKGSIFVGLYQKTEENGIKVLKAVDNQYKELNSANSYSVTFEKLDSRLEYDVKELRPVTDKETPEFTINGGGYIKVDSITNIGNSDYKVTYSDMVTDSSDNTQKNIIITNNRLGTIEIIKVDSKDSGKLLEGAEFKLQKKDEEGNFYDVLDATGNVLTVTTDGKGKAKFYKLEPGTYKIIETKAPTGYALSGAEITTDIGVGENKVFDVSRTITNSELYSLPSSGGPGTYMFTISGVAFITAALLLFINNKRKEDEARI